MFVKTESDYRVATRESQITEQPSFFDAAIVQTNQNLKPLLILKVFNWNACLRKALSAEKNYIPTNAGNAQTRSPS